MLFSEAAIGWLFFKCTTCTNKSLIKFVQKRMPILGNIVSIKTYGLVYFKALARVLIET